MYDSAKSCRGSDRSCVFGSMRQPRCYRSTKYLVVLCSAAVLTAWAFSGFVIVYYQGDEWGTSLEDGVIVVRKGLPIRDETKWEGVKGWSTGPGERFWSFGFIMPRRTAWPQGWVVYIVPMWLGLVPAIMAAPFLLLLKKHEPPPHCCQRCSYDLTGNASGVCPECGTPVTEEETADVSVDESGAQ